MNLEFVVQAGEKMSKIVGIRGAVTVDKNTRESILSSVRELLEKMVEYNGIEVQRIASVIFTATPDLDAVFPAAAARELGWNEVALLDAVEMKVRGSMPRVVRVLMHVNVEDGFRPYHVYLKDAVKLRPDLCEEKN